MKLHKVTSVRPDVRTYLNQGPFVLNDVLIGVEIEVENVRKHPPELMDSLVWAASGDGSLRNHGVEYILNVPMCGTDLDNALREAERGITSVKHEFTHRCSVHIHMDVRPLTTSELFSILVAYALVERVLFKYVGDSRDDNVFCVPMYKSEMPMHNLYSLLEESVNGIKSIPREKYSALNLSPIFSAGSIEFRHHYGTASADRIGEWINVLLSVRKFGLDSLGKIKELPDYISSVGAEEFIINMFGDALSKKLTYDEGDLYADLISGARVAQDLIHSKAMYECVSTLEPCEEGEALLNKFLPKTSKKASTKSK